MSDVVIRADTAGMLALPAVLTHAQAADFSCSSVLTGQTAEEVVVDASTLKQFDSSALAVLLECRRQALAAGKTFSVQGTPTRLFQLAGLYGVDTLIPPPTCVTARG